MYDQFPSLHHCFRNAASVINKPSDPYMWHKPDEEYIPVSYAEMSLRINAFSAFLQERGFRKGDRFAMVLENCPEYIYVDQGMMQSGVVNTAIYPTLSDKETGYILKDSGARGVLVGTQFLLNKVKKVWNDCPELELIITLFSNDKIDDPRIISLEKVFAEGSTLYGKHRDEIENAFQSIRQDDLAGLIYTSGTTGVPKGVMLSHGNFISNVIQAKKLVPEINGRDKFLSFLPLSHVYERSMTYYLSMYLGAQIAFAESLETLTRNIQETRPSVLICVPRLLERMHERILRNADVPGLSGNIFRWAMKTGETYRNRKEEGKFVGPLLAIKKAVAEKLVFSKIKAKLGGRIRMVISGGGALPKHIGEFFGNIGLRAMEGYGLTETSPLVSVNEFHRQVFGTVGRITPDQTVAILDLETNKIIATQTYESLDTSYESGEGEILVKGPNIMKGYWNKPQETAEVIDEDGWFHTGDIGRFHKGNLQITDRLKNMFKTSLGKNVYPTPIENAYLKSNRIEQIFLIGDKREYVSAIIIPSRESLKERFHLPDSFFEHADPMIEDPKILEWLEEDMRKLAADLAKYERIKSFAVKRNPFSIEEGEMTVTQKIKRKIVEERYRNVIESLYEPAPLSPAR